MPPLLGMEELGQPPGRIVAHDDFRLDPEALECPRLVVSVLLDSPPERPGVGHDDAHLHGETIP